MNSIDATIETSTVVDYHRFLCDSHACPCYLEGQGRKGLRTERTDDAELDDGCDPSLVDNPKTSLIANGVELHWTCCDRRVTVQKSMPFRLFLEQTRYFHHQAVLYDQLAARPSEDGS